MSRSLVPLSVLLFAAACSNSSSGGAPETTQLAVVAQYPAPASVAEPTSEVSVTFVEALDPASITSDSVQVVDDLGPIEGATTYDPATQTIRWTSRFGLTLSASHVATVLGTVRDLSGIELGDDLHWQFRVRDGIWSAPDPLTAWGTIEVKEVQMERSGKTWLKLRNATNTTYVAGTPGNWAEQTLPFEGDLIVENDGTMTNFSVRTEPSLGVYPLDLIVDAATRRSPEEGWLIEQVVSRSGYSGSAWNETTLFGDPIVSYRVWIHTWIFNEGLTVGLQSGAGFSWYPVGITSYGTPRISERMGPAGEVATLFSTGGQYWTDFSCLQVGEAPTLTALSPAIPRGTIMFQNHSAGRILLVQRETPSPGMFQITSRRIHPDGTVEAATVLHAHTEPLSVTVVPSLSGHAVSFIYAGPVGNGGGSFLVHRFDPDTGTWTSLPPLFTNSGNASQPQPGSIFADTRGTFWILSPERTVTGIPVLVVNRLRPQDNQMSLMLSAEWYELKAFDVDDSGRATMAVNAGLMRFQ